MPNSPKTLPQITVGLTPLPVSPKPASAASTAGFAHHIWALSVSIQADANNSGIIYVGDDQVSSTRYSRALNPGEWYTVAGSAVDPSRVYVLGSDVGQICHPSWN